MSEYVLTHNDQMFGIPEQKKFPLFDADHVRSAIKFFNYVDPKYEKQLAKAILRRAKEFGVDISEMNISDNNRFKKYLPNDELKHHGILGMKWGVRRYQNPDGSLTAEGKIRYRYDDRKGKYVKRSRSEQRQLRKQAKATAKARAAAEAAKRLKSPRDKNIKEMTDKQLEKYINRMANEKRALELKRDVNQLDPKPLTKGEQFVKKYVDGLIIPDLQKNGATYVNKLLDMAAKANKQDDKYAQAAKEATYWNNLNNIDNYKKQIEDRKSTTVDKYKEAEKERNYYVNKALALEKKKQYERLSQTEETLKSFELKEAIANVINDNSGETSWRIDYDVKNEKIK